MKSLGVLLMGAALLAGLALLAGCRLGGDPSSKEPARRTPATRSGNRPSRHKPQPRVDLAELASEVPEYQGRGRNLFDFGREPAPAPPVAGPAASAPTSTIPPSEAATSRPRSAPVRIELKFAGFVEKKQPGGKGKKYAVLLSGEEILTGAEGDIVGNRYRIVSIGLESVTVAVEGSRATQIIPLRTN